MIKEEVLVQFSNIGFSFSTLSELEDILSDEFSELYDDLDEAQEAFDQMDIKYNGLLGRFFVYTLSEEGETWTVSTGYSYENLKLPEYIQKYSAYYDRKDINDLDALLSSLETRVMKDMDNVGCDAKRALRMILDDLGFEDEFVIEGADASPRIEFLGGTL